MLAPCSSRQVRIVMLSFLSALSARRCLAHDDCDFGTYCNGLVTNRRPRDPLPGHGDVLAAGLGVCLGCGTRAPEEMHIRDQLEVLCPGDASLASGNSSAGMNCVVGCMDSCTSQAGFPIETKHISQYTDAERACATSCTLTVCASTLTGELGAKFDEAVGSSSWRTKGVGSDGVPHAYKVWLSLIAQCHNCAASVRVGVRFANLPEAENLRILKMSFLDFVSLGLATLIVALTMMREVRDMIVGTMCTLQAMKRDDEKKREGKAEDEFELTPDIEAWRWALGLQAFLRRYSILPDVAMVVVLMVSRFGGDTVSVMLNTLAALFMLELDNLAFDYGLTAGLKARVEEDFQVTLGAPQLRLLQWSRRWHVLAITVLLLVLTITMTLFETIWQRLRFMSFSLITLIAFGEMIEIYFRSALKMFRHEGRTSDLRRYFLFVIKVTLAFLWKWYVVHFLSQLALSSAPLDN